MISFLHGAVSQFHSVITYSIILFRISRTDAIITHFVNMAYSLSYNCYSVFSTVVIKTHTVTAYSYFKSLNDK